GRQRATHDAACTSATYGRLGRIRSKLHFKPHSIGLDDRRDVCLFPFLLAKDKRADKRHLATACRIWTRNRARPQPSDDGRVAAVGERDSRIELSDTTERLSSHEVAVEADVSGEPLRSAPGSRMPESLDRFRVHRRITPELGRNLDQCLCDQYRDGV